MAKYVLIGGGDTGRGNTIYETEKIDKYVVELTNKENPTFLFIGLASTFSDSYYDTMKKIYKELGCTTTYLKKKNIINNPDIVKNKIMNADIIYFCGGDTIKLMDTLKEYKVVEVLKEKVKTDCVFCGISAGAIAISKEGFSDSYILRGESDKYLFVKGLGLVDVIVCPHYEKNSTKDKELQEYLKNNKMDVKLIRNKEALVIDKDKQIYINE